MGKTALIDTKLSKEEIIKYFGLLNDELKIRNENGEIIICGDAALILMYNARSSTKDIDALYKPKQKINEIIKNFSQKYHLESDWLNDSAKVFFAPTMKTKIYKKYSNLTVKCFDTESLLALKLTSARDLTNDENDAITLMKNLKLKNVDEALNIIEKHIPEIRRTTKSFYFTKLVFERYKNLEKESDKNE